MHAETVQQYACGHLHVSWVSICEETLESSRSPAQTGFWDSRKADGTQCAALRRFRLAGVFWSTQLMSVILSSEGEIRADCAARGRCLPRSFRLSRWPGPSRLGGCT
jgi:hypothetical protein